MYCFRICYYASVFTCAVTAMVPSRFKLACSLIFKLSSPPAAVRVPQNGAFFLEIENGIVWNRDRVTAECEIVNRVNVVRYKIGMLRETGSFGTCSCSQNRR